MKRKRMSKRNDATWRQRAERALAVEAELRRRLAEAGLRLRLSTVTAGRTQFPHWVVYDGGRAVLHVWPAALKWGRRFRGCDLRGSQVELTRRRIAEVLTRDGRAEPVH